MLVMYYAKLCIEKLAQEMKFVLYDDKGLKVREETVKNFNAISIRSIDYLLYSLESIDLTRICFSLGHATPICIKRKEKYVEVVPCGSD